VPFFVLETTEVRIMAKVEKTITIKAPVEKVFSFIKPTNLPEIWPSLVETKDVQQLPNGGYSNRWVYKMAGIRLEGSSEDIEYVTNERVVSRTKGGVESTQTWIFQPDAGGTKVTFNVEYTVPIPVLGKLAEAIIVKMNEHEAELLLANLKTRIEA
jgi:uncharacterized membrane protein